MNIIELKNVSFTYNLDTDAEVVAVKNLSLTIGEGAFVALVGHNGSGKSTVAKLLNGLLLPDKGAVTVYGKSTKNKKELFEIRANLGVVFQNPDNQLIATIIEDDVAFGPENLGLKSNEIRSRVDRALKSVDMLDRREGTPFRLSGGQKQRVAIAGVLAIRPKIMVLDEATSMLDPVGRREVLDIVRRLNKDEKMTVIMITHFMEEAALADRIIVLKDGELILDGGEGVFTEEEKLKAAGLELPMPARVAAMLGERGVRLPRGLISVDKLANKLSL
ncbi:MAG: energy-coupling factor transporter ATPase [Firmicutes bacterium]|nr:energy-coupling factor transporter ATPase [Bacillota bacterium]